LLKTSVAIENPDPEGPPMLEQAFLQNIIENPGDDVARLAYADWLLERGDLAGAARGEFIQVQCQLARRAEGAFGEWADAGRLSEWKAREQALLAEHGAAWAAPVHALVECYAFRRGFVEEVTLDGAKFLRHAEKLFALAPVQRVGFTTVLPPAVADSRYLARLTAIDLPRLGLGAPGLRTLLNSPHLGRLTSLDLSGNFLGDAAIRLLAESPYLAQLTTLNLADNQLSLDGVRALCGSPHWRQVRHLTLTGNHRIDARSRQFLSQCLGRNPDPVLLRALLQVSSRGESEYRNAAVRELARRAGANPAEAAAVLAEGLRGSHRKVRSAAAQMLGRLGARAASSLPLLVRRLFERNEAVRDHVAPALARLLPDLPGPLQEWLCLLANPLLAPLDNLRAALERPSLPGEVRKAFAALCARRLAWRLHLAAGAVGAPHYPDPASVAEDGPAVWQSVQALGDLGAQSALKGLRDATRRAETFAAGRDREHAWLLARLCELLQAHALAGGT
jgi:uncharacterized protein (TIGR02996 family)